MNPYAGNAMMEEMASPNEAVEKISLYAFFPNKSVASAGATIPIHELTNPKIPTAIVLTVVLLFAKRRRLTVTAPAIMTKIAVTLDPSLSTRKPRISDPIKTPSIYVPMALPANVISNPLLTRYFGICMEKLEIEVIRKKKTISE